MPQDKKKTFYSPLFDQTSLPTPSPTSDPNRSFYSPVLDTTPTPSPTPQPKFFSPVLDAQQQEPGIIGNTLAKIGQLPGAQAVISTISPVLDFLSRPSYGSAKFADSLADDSKSIFDAVMEGFGEVFNPKERLSYSDVIKRRFPEFAIENPTATTILGFLGDVALDPTTYLGAGLVKNGVTVGSKILARPVERIFKEGLDTTSRKVFLGKNGTLELVEKVDRLNNLKPKFEDVDGLFKYMKMDVADVGKKGINIEDDSLNMIKYVNRNPAGQATGILEMNFDDAGKILSSSLAVDPNIKGLNSIAYKLYKKAKADGYDLSAAADAGLEKFSSEGLNFAKRIAQKELADTGYFDAVAAKQSEIETLFNKLSGDPNVDLAKSIAKDETLADLKIFGKERLTEELFTEDIRERVTTRIMKLAEMNPELKEKFFAPKGVYLKFGLPFGKQRDLVRLVGLEGLSNKVQALTSYVESAGALGKTVVKAGRSIAETFSRDFGLPEEFITRRNELENELQFVVGQTVRDTVKLFNNTDLKGRERIGSAMAWIDDETRKLEQIRAQSTDPTFRDLTNGEAAQIFQQGLERFKLTSDEKAIATLLQQDYKEAALLEMRAGILKNNLVNYSPRGYEVIADADDMSMITRSKYNPQGIPLEFLSSNQKRKYLTNAEAEAAGLVPELDAALLYAHRIVASKRALAIKEFRDSVEEIFSTKLPPKSTVAHTGILPTTVLSQSIPQRVIDDMRLIGESVYPSGLNGTQKQLLQGFDAFQRLFKRAATTVRPGFAVKQSIANTIQSALVSGVKAFKALDPRVAADSALLLGVRRGKPTGDIPFFLNNFITKNFTGNQGLDGILASRVVLSKIVGEEQLTDFAKQFSLTTTLGQKYTGEELIDLARRNGIIRELDSTGEQFTKKIADQLTGEKQSYKNVAKELGKVWNHASLVEDYSRMNLFLNGIRMGYTARDAAKTVNGALFDYARGLSSVERSVIRRVLPFYSFQRFALPFVFKQTLKQPGNPATLDKVVKTVEKLLVTGEELNPGEENVFNSEKDNFLLTQPRLLSGFDKDGKLNLNLLNNLTPFDVLNLFAYDKEGKLDVQRTAEKTLLGAMTPFIKIPLQVALDKDFFTDKAIKQATVYGDLSSMGNYIPNFTKELIGWEDRKNEITGKTTTYISPFLGYYAMQVFPVLRDYLKGNEDVDYSGSNVFSRALFSAMNMVLESSKVFKQTQVDLAAQEQYQYLKVERAEKNLMAELNKASIRGSKVEFEKAIEDFNNLIASTETNIKAREGQKIRGTGIAGTKEQEDQIESQLPTQNPPVFK